SSFAARGHTHTIRAAGRFIDSRNRRARSLRKILRLQDLLLPPTACTFGMTRYAGCSGSIAMTDRKPCIRCERSIDGYARACPYCNWDQSQAALPPQQAPGPPAYVPPDDRRIQGKLLGAIAFVALLIIAFVVGTFIHGYEPNE